MTDNSLWITKHAIKRVKERTGLKKKLSEKLLLRALADGVQHKDTKGRLRKYVDWLYFSHDGRGNNNIRIYNNYVFVCSYKTFVTIVPLPNQYKKAAKELQNKKV